MKSINLLILLATFIVNAATATPSGELNQRQFEILFSVLNPYGGYINENIHREFWNEFNLSSDDIQEYRNETSKSKFQLELEILKSDLTINQDLVFAAWKSADLSIKAGKIVYHPDYLLLKEKVKLTKGDKSELMIFRSEQIILSAVNKTPVITSMGIFVVNPQIIEQSLIMSKVPMEMFGFLLDYDWRPVAKKYNLKEAHVNVSHTLPFSYRKIDDVKSLGLAGPAFNYTAKDSPNGGITVFWGVPAAGHSADKVMSGLVMQTLPAYGIKEKDISIEKTYWRGGLKGIYASGQGVLGQTKLFVDMWVIERLDIPGILSVSSVSDKDESTPMSNIVSLILDENFKLID